MDRNNQVTASSTPSEQGNIKEQHFSSHQVQLMFALFVTSILLLPQRSTPKIKIRDDYGKILSPKLKFV